MDHLAIQTEGGPLSIVGRIHADRTKPSLLVVRGSFPPKDHMLDLPTYFHGANVLVVTLPGMVSGTYWADNPNVAGLTRGLEQAVATLLPDTPMVSFGVSTGNILSLGLRLPNIRRRIAVEPFLGARDLWPFITNSRERLEANPGHERMARFFWEFFGIGAERLEDRDYGYLLEAITVPTDVVVGQLPLLPQRDLAVWPSFTSAADRARFLANPLVTLHEGPAGSGHAHGSVGAGYAETKSLIHAALHAVSRPEALTET